LLLAVLGPVTAKVIDPTVRRLQARSRERGAEQVG
jgi:hypothetical protein